ncbi:MAG: hypothetical protein H6663_09985 [Candidatus Promineofilum sp.]|nr:hypothetical protein [Promineifilum sp.]
MEQESSSEARLRHQLDVQSQQISRVLTHHRVPATITGGTVRSRLVSFELQTQIAAGLEKILGLKRDLGSALGVRIWVSQPQQQPIASASATARRCSCAAFQIDGRNA